MKFKLDVMRGAAVASLAVALLASCGGGTQIESFVPSRIIAFGDEASLINGDGTKYTVNGVKLDTSVSPSVPVYDTQTPPQPILECAGSQVWVQQMAYAYGMAFTECATTGYGLTAVMNAQLGAKVADLTAQVDAFLAGDSFRTNDLVTVMVGTNDIIDAAGQVDPAAAAEQAGRLVGAQVVRITDRGAKVIVSTVPDVGLTPYAINAGAVAQLHDLSVRFNTQLRLKLQDVRDGGRAVGLVLADELILAMVNPSLQGSYGLTVIDKPVCSVALPNCNMTTLDTAAVATSFGYDWLWADDRHLGANAQARLGALAVTRARNNPF